MKHIVRYGVLLVLLLTLAVDSMRAECSYYYFFAYGGDATSNGLTHNQNSFFSGGSTGSNNCAGSIEVNGKTIAITKRGSNSSTLSLSFSIPSGKKGTAYILANSNGSTPRTITLSATGYSQSGVSSTSASSSNAITYTNLIPGTYTFSASGNASISFAAVAVCDGDGGEDGGEDGGGSSVGGDCENIFYFAKLGDAVTNGVSQNPESFFTDLPSGSGNLDASVTIDGTTYTATGRNSNSTLCVAFSVPEGKVGYLYVAGSGSSGRTISIQQESTVLETLDFTSATSGVNFITPLEDGNYRLISSASVGLSILAVKLCDASSCLRPTINSVSADLNTVEPGTWVTLTASATKNTSGEGTLSYQWYKADNTVAGAAGESVMVRLEETTSYYCRVTDSDCSNKTKSDAVTVTVADIEMPVVPIPEDVDDVVEICAGESYEGYTTSGTYDIGGRKVQLVVSDRPSLSVSDTKYIPVGGFTSVGAYGAHYYVWSPASSLSDIHAASPVATPTVSTTYTVRAYNRSPVNLVKNGDFESGNAVFVTDLQTGRSKTGAGRFGKYIITNNPSAHTSETDYWADWGSLKDHTRQDGNGKYMVVDGTTEPDRIIWQNTVSVVPHTTYTFSAWFASLKNAPGTDENKRAKLQFFINGNPIGTVKMSPTVKDKWEEYHDAWNSGDATTAVITIKNQNTGETGNDFGLDDIGLYGLGPCYTEKEVKVVVTGSYQIDVYPENATVQDREMSESPESTFSITTSVSGSTPVGEGQYRVGDEVKLVAHDSECYFFSQWSDGVTEKERIKTITAESIALQAVYTLKKHTVTIHYNSVQGGVSQQE